MSDSCQLKIIKGEDITETGLYYWRNNMLGPLEFLIVQVSHVRDKSKGLYGEIINSAGKYHYGPVSGFGGLFEGPIEKPSDEFMSFNQWKAKAV